MQGGPKSKLSYFVHIFAEYLPIFTSFSPVDFVKNLLFIGMHSTRTMSLHYRVKHKYLKTNNIYRRAESLTVNECTVKSLKLFDKMFNMSSIFLHNRFETLSPFIDVLVNKCLFHSAASKASLSCSTFSNS